MCEDIKLKLGRCLLNDMQKTFSYSITEADFWDFARFHYGSIQNSRWRLLIFQIAVPVIVIAWIYVLTDFLNQSPAAMVVIGVISAAFTAVWILFLGKRLLQRIANSDVKIIKKPQFPMDVRLELREEGICQFLNGNETKKPYSDIKKVVYVESKAIYVYISKIEAFIIPFSAFENEAQRNEFLELLANKQTLQ